MRTPAQFSRGKFFPCIHALGDYNPPVAGFASRHGNRQGAVGDRAVMRYVTLDWTDLALLPDERLAHFDVAAVNLLCAAGLPGAEAIDIADCLRVLDDWAARVKRFTERVARDRERVIGEWGSWNRARIAAMVTVLQRDLGVHYRVEANSLPDEEFFKRSENLFVHGVIRGLGGTCTSLPVAYAAVGRRLGYPIKLVHTQRHCFARWDEPGGERFNIECTSLGYRGRTDEEYLKWPFPTSPEDAKAHGFLRSLTPRQEVAAFLDCRGWCAEANGLRRVAVRAYAWACQLDPESCTHERLLVRAMNRWDEELYKLMMPGFPAMEITMPPRLYPSVLLDLERGIVHLEAKERLLTAPRLIERFWGPLRKDPTLKPPRVPRFILVEYPRVVGGQVAVRFLESIPPYIDRSNTQPSSRCQP
jgi:hypothetical protein